MFGHKKKHTYTVFFCWQSDTPDQRKMIKKELLDQTYKVGEEHGCNIEIEEDSRGKAGMIPIADKVLSNIEKADIFVCDITPVASIINEGDFFDSEPRRKAMPNSNVMFELGYAMRCMHPSRIIAVANTEDHKWNEGEMPFDIFHRQYVKFSNEKDLDLGHELAKSIDFLKTYGRLDNRGNKIKGLLSKFCGKIVRFFVKDVDSDTCPPSLYESSRCFESLLALAFPGIKQRKYFGEDAFKRLEVLFDCYKKGDYPKMYLQDRDDFFDADSFEVIDKCTIRIGINVLNVTKIEANRSAQGEQSPYVKISCLKNYKESYDISFADNEENNICDATEYSQYYAVYTDEKWKQHVLTKEHYDDMAAYTKDGKWIDLRGKVNLRRIHLQEFSVKLTPIKTLCDEDDAFKKPEVKRSNF